MTIPSLVQEDARRGDIVDQAAIAAASDTSLLIAEVLDREPREMRTPQIKGVNGEVFCKDCGDQIAEKRLQAKTHATRCFDCQEKIERN